MLLKAWVLLLLVKLSFEEVLYVKPTAAMSCPGKPCLTINQYATETARYFTNQSVFIFLPGNHSMETTLNLTNKCNITLEGSEDDVFIACKRRISLLGNRVNGLNITRLRFFIGKNAMVLLIQQSNKIIISQCKFVGRGNLKWPTQAVLSEKSEVLIFNTTFKLTNGAILALEKSTLTLTNNIFTKNKADLLGGAIHASGSRITLTGQNKFSFNSALHNGGAIDCSECTIKMKGLSTFEKNTCFYKPLSIKDGARNFGGALSIAHHSTLIITGSASFLHNKAHLGGAIFLLRSRAILDGPNIRFKGNAAGYGGAMRIQITDLEMATNINFTSNTATLTGGAISIDSSTTLEYRDGPRRVTVSGHFSNNKAGFEGGAVSITDETLVQFNEINVTGNSNSAIYISQSNTIFETSTIRSNTGKLGGGIQSKNARISFRGITVLNNNSATIGGGISADDTSVLFEGVTEAIGNSAQKGGVIYASRGNVTVANTTNFLSNHAFSGGVLYLSKAAKLSVKGNGLFNSSSNTASHYGGVIYFKDSISPVQCLGEKKIVHHDLPECFLQLNGLKNTQINSVYDTAGRDGHFLYGGLLDKCRLKWAYRARAYPYYTQNSVIVIKSSNNSTESISSEPYSLCLCSADGQKTCKVKDSKTIHRGQTFSVLVQAVAQGDATTRSEVTATTSSCSRLNLLQSTQTLERGCSRINYTMYSTKSSEVLNLYVHGPCQDIRSPSVSINITLLSCPRAFTLSKEQCICEERLQRYRAKCVITSDKFIISRKTGSTFWMGTLYSNGSYQGLILYSTCPNQYCQIGNPNFTLDDLDAQCNHNRSGLLCGACATNYSLLLGGSKCGICTNNNLALILPFACAGVSLVCLLTFLKLTVATGMLNSLILYANIVQVNKNVFFPTPKNYTYFLTVFIAWLNLDLGFQTCFYSGLNAFAQTFLQFAFPVYVWIIISLIIFASQYSVTVSKLIGSNPVAVLSTLLLLSYTKMLKVIIDILSSVKLDYPNNVTVTVWLKDANEPYLQSKHLFLTVFTSIFLTLVFLPYTLLLLFGYKLYPFISRRHFQWLIRIKPLLDAHYAPFNLHTRYWSGLLLLARCALYAVFSYNSFGETNKSLLAIIITFTIMTAKVWLSGRIYKKLFVNLYEVSMYLNLIALSSVTLAKVDAALLVHLLVTIVFLTFLGIVSYHFHLQYVANTSKWRKITSRVSKWMQRKKTSTVVAEPASRDPHRIVTKTVIALREPLLET